MNRRELFKKAGLVALTSAPLLAGLPRRARADGAEPRFTFAGLSYDTANPTGEVTTVDGCGDFDPVEGEVDAGGCYQFINIGAPLPRPILEQGEWQATSLISWTPNGTYGIRESGVLVMGVTLSPVGGTPYSATLKVVCNIPFVPLLTGQPEGFVLTTPTITFAQGAAVAQPQVGVTLFCVGD